MVLKNCDNWLAKGYFSYMDKSVKDGKTTATTAQPGIAFPVWAKWNKIVENEA